MLKTSKVRLSKTNIDAKILVLQINFYTYAECTKTNDTENILD